MRTIKGRGASSGMALGKIKILRKHDNDSGTGSFSSTEEEMKKFHSAIKMVESEFEKLYKNALLRVGEKEAGIFEIHKMMLSDDDFRGEAERLIMSERIPASTASKMAGKSLALMFHEMDTEYMKARAADIIAVSERVAEVIKGESSNLTLSEATIIVADDLTPAETISLDKEKVKGFVTENGSDMSHTAILARMMGIPAVICTGKIDGAFDGMEAVIDGETGEMYIEPDGEVKRKYKKAVYDAETERMRLDRLRGKTCITESGERIKIMANVGDMQDVEDAVEFDAEGIGLFRTEFIFMRQNRPPTEDEQYEIYCAAARKMNGQECVIRTLDVGADKKIPYLTGDASEANPALGIRAVRLCLRMPELLITQFRALYRAAAVENISAMIPMIVLPSEVDKVKEIASAARRSLEEEGIPFGQLRLGIMIETPSAAILADLLAPMVDFFSVGTNDLIQYTIAADRENPDVAYLADPLPESVRRCIKMTCNAAKRSGIPVCVCGEIGADTAETKFLIEAGVTKISVAPSYVLKVREAVMSKTGMVLSTGR